MTRIAAKVARLPRTEGVRVAVYTRKSTDDGLEQEFNSLDAQRLAVESYVASQRANGWIVLPDLYDDGGFSGANLDRPAFQRLMADVAAGRVDVVAVHRLDRISRSLPDFLRVVEVLRSHGAAFVSTTQAFDSGTPVGRMVLSLLAVFGEFERSMIAQRTADKVHATRRRGGWTGGPPPIGFDLRDKRLVVNDEEAAQVRTIFATFIECGSVIATVERASAMGLRTKSWTTTKVPRLVPGRAFTKSTLRALLSNPVMIGRVRLGHETFPGAHQPIIDTATWDAAQAALSRRDANVPRVGDQHEVLLRGLLWCQCGSPMTTAWTRRGPRIHGAYVCNRAVKQGAAACPRARVPVAKLEAAVVERIRYIGTDPALVDETVAAARASLSARVPELAAAVRRHEQDRAQLERKRANVLEAVAVNGGASLNGKLTDLDNQVGAVDQRIAAAEAERAKLAGTTIDEAELRSMLAGFDELWATLTTSERARVLALLIERIVFDGPSGDVEITFRGCEP